MSIEWGSWGGDWGKLPWVSVMYVTTYGNLWIYVKMSTICMGIGTPGLLQTGRAGFANYSEKGWPGASVDGWGNVQLVAVPQV